MISVGMMPSSLCIWSNALSALSSFSARTSAPRRALYTAAFLRAPHFSRICATSASASIHRPWHPRQCTYAPHITVCGLILDASARCHTSSASAYRPARSAALTRCAYVYVSGRRCAATSSSSVASAPSQSPFLAYPPNRQLYEYVVTTNARVLRMRSNAALACAMFPARPAMEMI